MPWYDRQPSSGYEVIDRWEGGVGWLAHPAERGQRASHALRTDEGVWLLDPLDAPRVEALIEDLGEVVGVAVLSRYHRRDAEVFARRYEVPVHVPAWFRRVSTRLEVPVRPVTDCLGDSTIKVRRYTPLPGWREGIGIDSDRRTVYVPDALSALASYRTPPERVGMHTAVRLRPPRQQLAGSEPARLLFGHGEGRFEDASAALAETLGGARRRLPRALLDHGFRRLMATVAAARS